MERRRVLVTLESRATYGYAKNVMNAIKDYPIELVTLVTGMHLVPELGNSIDLIEQDGFPITAKYHCMVVMKVVVPGPRR